MPEGSAEWAGSIAIAVAACVILALLWRKGVVDPWRMPARDVSGVPAWTWLLGAVVIMGAQMMGAGLGDAAAARWGLTGLSHKGLLQLIALGAPALAGAGIVVLMARGMADGGRGAGLRARWLDVPVGVWCLLVAAPVTLGAGVVATGFHELVTGAKPDAIAHEGLRQMVEQRANPWTWALIAGAVVLGPVVEELVFRVFVGGAVLRLVRLPWAAIAVTAAVFALMHRAGPHPVPWHATAVLWVLGVALGVAYERTRRLGVPIVTHALFNAGNIMLALSIEPV